MTPETPRAQAPGWLLENGPRELESLFRAVVFHPSVAILITDNERTCRDASAGASKLLRTSRDAIVGHKMEDFADPVFRPRIRELWRTFLREGEQEGTLQLAGPQGTSWEVEYTAKRDLLPLRHLLVLREKTSPATEGGPTEAEKDRIPSWAEDYALFLLDAKGCIAGWYSGAALVYGYDEKEISGEDESLLYPARDDSGAEPPDDLNRSSVEGHFGSEAWHARKDGSRFWANVITMALRDDRGELQGFARIVRDFSARHERDEKLQRRRARVRPVPPKPSIAGIVSGEFDRIQEANDAFLRTAGYSREDLLNGCLRWLDLRAPADAALEELAHEECLRFGACTPYETDLLRKDGTRVPVLIATAVLQLSPYRWISFVQDLRERDRLQSIDEEESEPKKEDFEEIVGTSAALRRVQRQVELVAPTDANVLILGETGTGKELVARAIHKMSSRRGLPFVTLNCAAIPTGLLESELFGYERGAFTGALSQKIGRFETAHRGTLFLDEVGDIPLDLQPKLLRALQEKAFERLGGTRTIPIDVRLVAATNRNLTQMMGDKLFRSDLYYRLKVFPITTPPLRDHAEDIPLLARHFTKKYAAKMGRQIDQIPSDTMRALVSWHWPGNVRELENFIERSVILSRGPSLRAPLSEIRPQAMPVESGATLEQVERDHILRVLRESGGVVTTAATRLGLHRTTLNAMLRRLGISRKDF